MSPPYPSNQLTSIAVEHGARLVMEQLLPGLGDVAGDRQGHQAHVPGHALLLQPRRSVPALPCRDSSDGVTDEDAPREGGTHQEAIKQVLFIYAKLNPGIRYVQGAPPS